VLLRKGGLIAIDNTLWSGAVVKDDDRSKDTVAIRELNDFIANDKRVASSLLSVGDGLSLALKL
jgi:predicted O-methyltransferase YrrM